MAFQTETQTQILQRMINKIVARSNLTDVTDTGQFFKVLVAVARQFERIYHAMEDLLDETDLDEARGVELDERAKVLNPDEISRNPEEYATGKVQFGRATAAASPITISVGTTVKVPDLTASEELKYATTTVGTILTGATTSNLVSIKAQEKGSKFNVDPGSITAFGSKPSGVDTVTNPASLTTGQDEESDDSFRSRIKLYIKGLSRATAHAVEDAAMGVQDASSGKTVQWAGVWEDEFDPGKVIVYIDDGAGTAESYSSPGLTTVIAAASGGEVDIYLPNKPIHESYGFTLRINTVIIPTADYWTNYASGHVKLKPGAYPNGLAIGDAVTYIGTHYTGLVQEVQKVVDGDPSDRANYPGIRAGGIYARVRVPQIQYQTVTANVTVQNGYDQATALAAVAAVIQGYINHLSVGEDVLRNELIERIMAVAGVYNVLLTLPPGDVVISDTQLARVTGNFITVT